jgi:hypothetical protein
VAKRDGAATFWLYAGLYAALCGTAGRPLTLAVAAVAAGAAAAMIRHRH